jgi:hypothetical protein
MSQDFTPGDPCASFLLISNLERLTDPFIDPHFALQELSQDLRACEVCPEIHRCSILPGVFFKLAGVVLRLILLTTHPDYPITSRLVWDEIDQRDDTRIWFKDRSLDNLKRGRILYQNPSAKPFRL